MPAKDAYLAIDLGAESGRAMLGVCNAMDDSLVLHEIHRFPHAPVTLPSGMHWDLTGIWNNLLLGLKKTGDWCRNNNARLRSVGVDTWGVDFGLLGASGELLALPHAYRDPRNTHAFERVIARLGRERIWDATGIQFMALNTLYQLEAIHAAEPDLLEATHRLLMMPDLLHFFLSGRMVNERTAASTTQCLDPRSGEWARDLLEELHIPHHYLSTIEHAGSTIGHVRSWIATDCDIPDDVQVIATGSHDTASAVAAVPAQADDSWCFLSSGTWSCLGAEIAQPCLSREAFKAGFTNEAGVGGSVRFLTNIVGLWLVQECRREFRKAGNDYSYEELTQLAAEAEPLRTVVDVSDPAFLTPGHTCETLSLHARQSAQPLPRTLGEYVRCCLESLAIAYATRLTDLEQVLGKRFETIHLIGGGSRNDLLNQMTADATGRQVLAGPAEATATGNLLVQRQVCDGTLSLADLRDTSRSVIKLRRFSPNAETSAWIEAAAGSARSKKGGLS